MWLKIEPESAQKVTLQWGGSEGHYPCRYSVELAPLATASQKIRDLLTALAMWSASKDPEQLGGLLRKLAVEGGRLRFLLFESEGKAAEISEMRGWIDDQLAAGDNSLTITADPRLHIPWGLAWGLRVRLKTSSRIAELS
jgi:hypothetical protein